MKLKNNLGLAVVAVAMVMGSGAAHAIATLTGAHLVGSVEGLAGGVTPADNQITPTATLTLGANYQAGDVVTLSFTGISPSQTTTAPSLVCAPSSAAHGNPTFGFVNYPSASSFHYRVNNVAAGTTDSVTVGAVCTLGGFTLNGADLAAAPSGTTVVLTYTALTFVSNLPLDSGTLPLTLFHVLTQYTNTVTTAFSQTVDITVGTADRKLFVSAPTTHDTLAITTGDVCATPVAPEATACTVSTAAVLTGISIKVLGDFSFTDTGNNGICGDDALGGHLTVSAGSTVTVAADCQSATIVAPAAVGTVTMLVTTADTAAFHILTAPQSFNENTTFAYTAGTTAHTAGTETDSASAGAWGLNGFHAFVAYMPFGATIDQVVYLTNKSGVAGPVAVTGYDSAGTKCTFNAGTAAAGTVTALSAAIKGGFQGCYGTGTDKVSFTVTAQIPGALAELYTSYNVNGNRVNVVNTSNGRVTQTGNSTTGGNL
jgi:hypothetical protein